MLAIYATAMLACFVWTGGANANSCASGQSMTTKTATERQIRDAADSIGSRSLNDFSMGQKNPDQNSRAYEKMKSLTSNEERRNTALCLYFAAITECKKKKTACKLCELVFIARELSIGDPTCYFLCSQMITSLRADRLPTHTTFATFLKSGIGLKEDGQTEDEFKALVKKGMTAAGISSTEKRFASLAVLLFIMAAKFVVFVASNVAIGYITENSEDTYGTQVLNNDILGPLSEVASAGGSCFVDTAVVNVYMGRNQIIAKQLKDIKVGDHVESIDEVTGKQVYSPVYYMAHTDGDQKASLLKVFYKADEKNMKSLGLSRRHLIYASKGNHSRAPLDQPIRADAVRPGDHVWIMESGQLAAKEVVEIIPFVGGVRHPLTENHHIVVDGVHASVHVLNENLYRGMTSPLRLTYWLNPEWNNGGLVNKMVRFVEYIKEPIFNPSIAKAISHLATAQSTLL